MVPEKTWNGSSFDIEEVQTVPKRGERPVVAFIGGEGDAVAVQFQQQANSSGAAFPPSPPIPPSPLLSCVLGTDRLFLRHVMSCLFSLVCVDFVW